MLIALVRSWCQDWQHAGAELTTDVLHALAVRTTSIDAALADKVGSEDAIAGVSIIAISAPPCLPFMALLADHLCENLSKQSVTVATIDLSIYGHLGCLEAVELAGYALLSIIRWLIRHSEGLIHDAKQLVLEPLGELNR